MLTLSFVLFNGNGFHIVSSWFVTPFLERWKCARRDHQWGDKNLLERLYQYCYPNSTEVYKYGIISFIWFALVFHWIQALFPCRYGSEMKPHRQNVVFSSIFSSFDSFKKCWNVASNPKMLYVIIRHMFIGNLYISWPFHMQFCLLFQRQATIVLHICNIFIRLSSDGTDVLP